jgi:hypothetical protein
MQGIDGYTQEEIDDANNNSNKKIKTVATCPHCGLKGHATRQSRKCLQYAAPSAPVGGNNKQDDLLQLNGGL